MSAVPVVVNVHEREDPEPGFRSIFLAGAPRFAREAFGPVAAFYVGYELVGLVAGIVLASASRDRARPVRAPAGTCRARSRSSQSPSCSSRRWSGSIADSAVVYLAQPVHRQR